MLSVIVPVYNAEKYIDECLASLLAQTYEDMEVVCVDDGSTDSSPVKLDEYAKKYPQIKVFHISNSGTQAARNYGLEHSSGDLIALVDNDDVVDPQMYSLMIKAMTKTGSDIVSCGYKTEYGRNIQVSIYDQFPEIEIFDTQEDCIREIDGKLSGFVWNKVIKREAYGNIRFRTDVSIIDDKYLLYDIMPNVTKACRIDLPFYHYRYLTVAFSKKAPIARFMNCLSGFTRLITWVDSEFPQCSEGLHKDFLFWNTKTCERMLSDYHEEEFKQIQAYVNDNKAYIPRCPLRVRILSKAIQKSWNVYRPLGFFLLFMKRAYVGFCRIRG